MDIEENIDELYKRVQKKLRAKEVAKELYEGSEFAEARKLLHVLLKLEDDQDAKLDILFQIAECDIMLKQAIEPHTDELIMDMLRETEKTNIDLRSIEGERKGVGVEAALLVLNIYISRLSKKFMSPDNAVKEIDRCIQRVTNEIKGMVQNPTFKKTAFKLVPPMKLMLDELQNIDDTKADLRVCTIASSLNKIGHCYNAVNKTNEALHFLLEGLDMMKRHFQTSASKYVIFASLENNIAFAYSEQLEIDVAHEYMKAAVRDIKKADDSSDERRQSFQKDFEKSLANLEKNHSTRFLLKKRTEPDEYSRSGKTFAEVRKTGKNQLLLQRSEMRQFAEELFERREYVQARQTFRDLSTEDDVMRLDILMYLAACDLAIDGRIKHDTDREITSTLESSARSWKDLRQISEQQPERVCNVFQLYICKLVVIQEKSEVVFKHVEECVERTCEVLPHIIIPNGAEATERQAWTQHEILEVLQEFDTGDREAKVCAQASCLAKIGTMYYDLSMHRKALSNFEEGQALCRRERDSNNRITTVREEISRKIVRIKRDNNLRPEEDGLGSPLVEQAKQRDDDSTVIDCKQIGDEEKSQANSGPWVEVGDGISVNQAIRIAGDHEIFKGKLRSEKVAVKRVPATEELKQELSRIAHLKNHPNVITYKAAGEWSPEEGGANKTMFLAMELCCPNSLYERVRQKRYATEEQKEILQQILDGVRHLHDSGVTHGNLRPQNLLYSQHDQTVKIAGFVGATREARTTDNKKWSAPEGTYTIESDIFSTGLMFYYILSNGKCLPTCTISVTEEDFDCEEANIACYLVRCMTQEDPAKRPSADECLRSAFFWNTNRKLQFLAAFGQRLVMSEHKRPYSHGDTPKHPCSSDLQEDPDTLASALWSDRRIAREMNEITLRELVARYAREGVIRLSGILSFIQEEYENIESSERETRMLFTSTEEIWRFFNVRFPTLMISACEETKIAPTWSEDIKYEFLLAVSADSGTAIYCDSRSKIVVGEGWFCKLILTDHETANLQTVAMSSGSRYKVEKHSIYNKAVINEGRSEEKYDKNSLHSLLVFMANRRRLYRTDGMGCHLVFGNDGDKVWNFFSMRFPNIFEQVHSTLCFLPVYSEIVLTLSAKSSEDLKSNTVDVYQQ